MNRHYQVLALLPVMISLGLAGCTLQPDYHRPAMP